MNHLNSFPFPKSKDVSKAIDEIGALYDEGDLETKNALRDLTYALPALMSARDAGERLEASQEELDALDLLSHRCKVIGSSALQ